MSSSTNNALNTLTGDELKVVLGPINNFLTALQAPGVNVQAVAQGWVQLQLAELQNEPIAQAVGINNIAAIVQAKLNTIEAKLTAVPTAAATPTPAVAASVPTAAVAGKLNN